MKLTEIAKQTGDAIAIHYVALDDLESTFLLGNSKKHDTTKLIESIRRYGFRDPISFDPSLNDGKGGIVEGNGRLESLIEMRSQGLNLPRGLKENWAIPVIFGVNATSEAEAVAFSIEHNWSVLWGSDIELEQITSMFDDSALEEQLRWLDVENSLPIAVEDNLDELIESLEEGGTERAYGEVIEDEVPDPEDVETRVKRGDVWKLGKHRLYCGDSTDEEKIRQFLGDRTPLFMATDPPYGVSYDSSWREKYSSGEYSSGKIANDERADWGDVYRIWNPEVLYAWHGGLHAGLVAKTIEDNNFEIRAQIIWNKSTMVFGRGAYHWKHEPCWYAVKKGCGANWQGDRKQTTVWDCGNNSGAGRTNDEADDFHADHISQKPVKLYVIPILNHTKPGDLISEPFLGSGTGLIAAEQTGRICYGCELTEKFASVVVQRWENFTGETAELERKIE